MGNCCSKRNEERYHVVDGRKYHRIETSNYPLPHDEGEVERLTLQHRVFKHHLGGRNYCAPVTDLLNAGGAVLDVGCGPGSWTLDMVEEFPKSKIYGIDISPEFMETSAPNAKFVEANVLDGLPYPDATFDFVYTRALVAAFTIEQWKTVVIPELSRVTKAGGWVELFDLSFEKCTGSPAYLRIMGTNGGWARFCRNKGLDPNLAENLPAMLEANGGFSDITKRACVVPLGKKSGKWEEEAYFQNCFEVFDAAVPMLAEALNITHDHVRAINEAFKSESRTMTSYCYFTVVYARKKPLEVVTC